MSEVHKDSRAGKVDLGAHGGFVAEVKRRLAAAGLPDEEIRDLAAKRGQRVDDSP